MTSADDKTLYFDSWDALRRGYYERAPGALDEIIDEHQKEIQNKRGEMLELLCKARLAQLDGWTLIEERSPDGLKTTWRFEKHT